MSRPKLVRIHCPQCQNGLKVRREHHGRKTTCPKCSTKFRISLTQSESFDPPVAKQAIPKPAIPKPAIPKTAQLAKRPSAFKVDSEDSYRIEPATGSREVQSRNKAGPSWLMAFLVLVGFFAVCSVILAIFLFRNAAANGGAIAKGDSTIEENQPAFENSKEPGESSIISNADSQTSPPPTPKDSFNESPLAATETKPAAKSGASPMVESGPKPIPRVFSTLSAGNQFGYSVSITAQTREPRRKAAVSGGMGMRGTSGRGMGSGAGRGIGSGRRGGSRGGMRGGVGGGMGNGMTSGLNDAPGQPVRSGGSRESDEDPSFQNEPPSTPEVIRWEGLASYTVTKKSGFGEGSQNDCETFGYGIPGKHVLVSPFKMSATTEVKVRVDNRTYLAKKVSSVSPGMFMVFKIDQLPVDFQPLTASRDSEIQPYKRFNKSVWNYVWRADDGTVAKERAVTTNARSSSRKNGTVCWRAPGKIGGICFKGDFISARKIQDMLPEAFGNVFQFDFDPKRRPDFADTGRFEKQVSANLIKVFIETENKAQIDRSVEDVQIEQNTWLGQFVDNPVSLREIPELRGPFINESSSYWHTGTLHYVNGKLVEANKRSRPKPSMPLLLPKLDEIVFQDFANVTMNKTQDAIFLLNGHVKLLEDGAAQNLPLESQYLIGEYDSKLTSVERKRRITKVTRKTTVSTSEKRATSRQSRGGRASSSSSYTFPLRIEQDEVFEFDNETGTVKTIRFSGVVSQGEGAKRQASVPYTVNIERTTDASPVLTPETRQASVVSGDMKKLPLTSKVRDRIVELLTSPSKQSRVKGLEMLNLYEPRKEYRIEEQLLKTLDIGFWESELVYKMACDWIYDPRIHNLLKDSAQRNDFRNRPLEQQALLFLMEKFPERGFIGNTYPALFGGLLRSEDKSIRQETIRILSENYPNMFEEVILRSEIFTKANREPPLTIIELLGELGKSKTIDELKDRAEEIESRKTSTRQLPRNEGERLRAYQAAILKIETRINAGRKR